jgi:hypothetical protein
MVTKCFEELIIPKKTKKHDIGDKHGTTKETFHHKGIITELEVRIETSNQPTISVLHF